MIHSRNELDNQVLPQTQQELDNTVDINMNIFTQFLKIKTKSDFQHTSGLRIFRYGGPTLRGRNMG